MLSTALTSAGCEPVRVSQVESQTKALDAISKDLHEIVLALTQKLSSVTRGSNPEMDEDPQLRVPEEMLVPLAANLRETWRSINVSVNRLREMNDQVELPSS